MLTPLLTYRGHTIIVSHLAWSLDGTRLASASADGIVAVCHFVERRYWVERNRHD